MSSQWQRQAFNAFPICSFPELQWNIAGRHTPIKGECE